MCLLQFEPVITSDTTAHVHHMLLYKCADLTSIVGANNADGRCHTVHEEARDCRDNLLIAAWAVGAEVCKECAVVCDVTILLEYFMSCMCVYMCVCVHVCVYACGALIFY